ncbi:hypothetical protein TNCV_327011 [Trichonephila clavipes]|nr:hypothetical protein TNCV_327011 [Trichonephila clavipes]
MKETGSTNRSTCLWRPSLIVYRRLVTSSLLIKSRIETYARRGPDVKRSRNSNSSFAYYVTGNRCCCELLFLEWDSLESELFLLKVGWAGVLFGLDGTNDGRVPRIRVQCVILGCGAEKRCFFFSPERS